MMMIITFSFTSPVIRCVSFQVSFYRGEVPNDLPEEVASKRKGHDNQWMATLPLRIPVSNLNDLTPVQNAVLYNAIFCIIRHLAPKGVFTPRTINITVLVRMLPMQTVDRQLMRSMRKI